MTRSSMTRRYVWTAGMDNDLAVRLTRPSTRSGRAGVRPSYSVFYFDVASFTVNSSQSTGRRPRSVNCELSTVDYTKMKIGLSHDSGANAGKQGVAPLSQTESGRGRVRRPGSETSPLSPLIWAYFARP